MFGCQETHLSCKSKEKPRILEKIHHLWQPRNPPVEVLQIQEKIGKKKKMPKVFSPSCRGRVRGRYRVARAQFGTKLQTSPSQA